MAGFFSALLDPNTKAKYKIKKPNQAPTAQPSRVSTNRFAMNVRPGDTLGGDIIGGKSGPVFEATSPGDAINRIARNYTVDVGDATSRIIQDTFLGGKGQSNLLDYSLVQPNTGITALDNIVKYNPTNLLLGNFLNNKDFSQVLAPGDVVPVQKAASLTAKGVKAGLPFAREAWLTNPAVREAAQSAVETAAYTGPVGSAMSVIGNLAQRIAKPTQTARIADNVLLEEFSDPFLSGAVNRAKSATTEKEKLEIIDEINTSIKETRETFKKMPEAFEGESVENIIKEQVKARNTIINELSLSGQIKYSTESAKSNVQQTINAIKNYVTPKQGVSVKTKNVYTKRVGKKETPIYALSLRPADVAAAQWRLGEKNIDAFVDAQITEGSRDLAELGTRDYIIQPNSPQRDLQQAGVYSRKSAKKVKEIQDYITTKVSDSKRAKKLLSGIDEAIAKARKSLEDNAENLRPKSDRNNYRIFEVREATTITPEEQLDIVVDEKTGRKIKYIKDGKTYNLIPLSEGMDHLIPKNTIAQRVMGLIDAGMDDAAIDYIEFMNSFDNFFALNKTLNTIIKGDFVWDRAAAEEAISLAIKEGRLSRSAAEALKQDWNEYLKNLDIAHKKFKGLAEKHGLNYEDEINLLKEYSIAENRSKVNMEQLTLGM